MHFSLPRRYAAIYADPPWAFRNCSEKGTGRNAISHYDCMSSDDLKRLPVAEMAADDCALFLWATDPLLPRAFELISAWGFTYRPLDSTGLRRTRLATASSLGLLLDESEPGAVPASDQRQAKS